MNEVIKTFTSPPKLKTPRLILRRMTRRDAGDMFEYAHDPEVTRYLLWAPHPDRAYTLRYLRQVENSYKKGKFYDWGVEYRAERKFIGTCGVTAFDLPNSTAELGYVISPAYSGRGIATEALSRVIEFCFLELGLNRLEAHYLVGNEPSRRVMEKCGMSFEGVRRGSLFVRDGYEDVGVCAILRSDFDNERAVRGDY